jgi:hypothetical protein
MAAWLNQSKLNHDAENGKAKSSQQSPQIIQSRLTSAATFTQDYALSHEMAY